MASQDLISSKFNQLDSEIAKSVPNKSLQEGKVRYGKWVKRKRRWTKDDYNHRGFRAAYFRRQFSRRARLVCRVLEHCDSRKKLPKLFPRKRKLKVVSFGCGPGSGLLGFQHFYQGKKVQRIKRLQDKLKNETILLKKIEKRLPLQNSQYLFSILRCTQSSTRIHWLKHAKITYTGYDLSRGWKSYVRKLGYNFKVEKVNKDFVDTMKPVDLAILCYFSHSAGLHITSIFNNYLFWKRLTDKCKAVLVLDTTRHKKFHHMLSRIGFIELETKFEEGGKQKVYTSLWTRKD